jgi:zearalenone synthase (highly reducing iterative type I polyketide synthase)
MGEIPDDHIGREASGIILRIGKAVTRFQPGDRVCCLGGGAHATVFRATEMVCNHIPKHLSFADAASFPVVFCTAFHALVDLMRVQKGQSILIHAAAGGVGQAALQIAKHFELEIFATVGSPDKRAQIETLYGIPSDHIFNSRDMSFAPGIMRATKGNGVDFILNSLSGEALRQTWNCIAPFGTFVEIGIKDILMNSSLDMRPFAQHATFCFFNLEKMQRLKPERLAGIFNRVMVYIEKGIFHPVTPVVTYPVSQLEDGFRLMQAGKHRGKITLSFDDKDIVTVLSSTTGIARLRADKTYVLVGGLGGLGRSLANLLIDDGARHLCFLSRSGASTASAQALVADLESRDIHVKVLKCDIAEESSLKEALQTCSDEMPAIKGVFQGAMVLRDALFETMTHEQWVQSTRPKIQGTWNLHKYLPSDLDFFITLSSFSGIFGNRGQANYAAGCTFQDSLAHYRHSQCLKAVSIDLGIMRDVGVLAEQGATGSIAAWVEPFGIREQEFHVLINMTIASQLSENWQQSSTAQIITGVPTGDAAHAAGVVPYFLEEDLRFSVISRRSESSDNTALGNGKSELSASLASQLSAVQNIQEAQRIVTDAIVAKLTKSLQTSASEIDEMRPLHHYGVDSLVAMEMRNWIVRDLKSEISLFDILAHTPIVQLAGIIVMNCRVLPEGLRANE